MPAMSKLLPVAELLMLGAIGGQDNARKQDRVNQIIFGAAALLGVVAVIYLIFALSYWLRTQYSPDVAALATGGIALTVALLIAAVGYTYNVIRKSKIEAVTDEMKEKVVHALETMSEEMEDPIRNYPKSSIAIATLAGYLVGNRVL
jgi:hypothetical protein